MKTNILAIIFILSLLSSCGQSKQKTELTTIQKQAFFGIVYQTVGVRAIGADTWIKPKGVREMKYAVTTDLTTEDLPPNLEGTFSYFYSDYSTDVNSSIGCGGGYKGTFIVNQEINQTVSNSDTTTQDAIYDIFNQYNTNGNSTTTNVELKVYTYNFNNTTTEKSFYPVDKCPNPSKSHTIRLVRLESGELIVDENDQGLQYYLIPKVLK